MLEMKTRRRERLWLQTRSAGDFEAVDRIIRNSQPSLQPETLWRLRGGDFGCMLDASFPFESLRQNGTKEAKARIKINKQLEEAGWRFCDECKKMRIPYNDSDNNPTSRSNIQILSTDRRMAGRYIGATKKTRGIHATPQNRRST